ncbi:MAG: trypsin, partial [Verrucomicrobiae bacterium]|nr:trypsin [Verrucomicrobiae bacterium]
MKNLLPLIVLLSIIAIPLRAQESMGLYLASRYGGSPLEINRLNMDVSIVGDRAITTLDFTFENKMDHILEGEFRFPLQEGQSVYRLALELGQELREASIVEKNKGRESFETISRRKIDPALLEKTAGNLYTAKVYPIPRLGTRRVVIGLEESLS